MNLLFRAFILSFFGPKVVAQKLLRKFEIVDVIICIKSLYLNVVSVKNFDSQLVPSHMPNGSPSSFNGPLMFDSGKHFLAVVTFLLRRKMKPRAGTLV